MSLVFPCSCTALSRAYWAFLSSHLGAGHTSSTSEIPWTGLAGMRLVSRAHSQKADSETSLRLTVAG
jgi:hypothetical protein